MFNFDKVKKIKRMNLDLQNKRAIVCGSTQGIGKAAALEIAALGAHVTLVARNEEKLKAVLAELDTTQNQQHEYLVIDFANPTVLKQKIEAYAQEKAEAHILINNTGGPAGGPIFEAKTEAFSQAFSQHLVCNHILVQTLVPLMKKAGYILIPESMK